MHSRTFHRTAPIRFALAVLSILVAPLAGAEVIDDFETAQATLTDTGSSVVNGAVILGSNRELEIELVEGTSATAEVSGGSLLFDATAGGDSVGAATTVWDADANTTVFDGDGLGGVDLTDNDETAFRIQVEQASVDTQILLEVFTNNGNSSKAGLRLPAVAATQNFFISYADFITNLGTGADFADVGAIVLRVLGGNVAAEISHLETVGPTLTVTKIDIDPNDDMDFGTDPVIPGDTIRYQVQITNDGGLAQQVDMVDTVDTNTSFTADSLTATPVALVDTVAVLGNVTRTVADPGVLGNDQDPDGDALFVRVSNSDTVSAEGATIAWNDAGSDDQGEGGFQYFPPAGFRGVDSFTYELEDADGETAAGQVTVILDRIIWFIDDDHGGPFEGTLANPFADFTQLDDTANDVDRDGDIIFVFAHSGGNYIHAGLELEPGQSLIGEGEGLTVDGNIIVPAGASALIHAPDAGAGIQHGATLTMNNTIRGVTFGTTEGSAIFGSGFGTLTVSNTTVIGAGGILDADNGTLDVVLNSSSSSAGPGFGIDLDSVDGTFDAGSTTITGGATGGIRVTSGASGATFDFGPASVSGVPQGVDLNTSSMASFTFDSLDITTTGTALNLANAGSVSIGGVTNTLETTASGPAILAATTEMTGGWTFANVTSDGSATHGISLNGMTGGNFLVTGATDINDPTNNGILVTSGGPRTYDFGATDISGTGVPAGAVGHGIDITSGNTMSTFTFDSLAITTDNGTGLLANGSGIVNIAGAGNTITAAAGPALDIASTTVDDVPGGAVTGITFATLSSSNVAGDGLNLDGVVGSVTANGGTITNSGGIGIDINAHTANFTYAGTVDNNGGRSVEVTNSGGTPANFIAFAGSIDDEGTGIFLDNNDANSGATVRFRGGMALDTGSNTAITVTNGGVVEVCATNDCGAGGSVANTIGAAAALSTTAVEIDNTAIGPNGFTLQSLSVDQAGVSPDVPAILLTSTGMGPFSINGVGSIAGSGGTIENLLNSDGVRLSSTGGRVTLRNMIIEDIGDADDASDGYGTRSEVDGVHGQNVTGGLTIRGTTMRRFSDNAVLGASFANSLSSTVWAGLEIIDSTIQDSNRYHVGPSGPGGLGDDSAEGMVRILGISGTVLIDNSTLERGGQLIDFLTASSGLLTMTVQRSNFNHSIKEFLCMPPGTVNIGKAGLSLRVTGSTNVDLFVGDPAEANPVLGNTFLDNATASIVLLHDDPAASGEIDTIISRNTFRVLDHLTGPPGCPSGSFQFNSPQGGVLLGPGAGAFEGIVSHNLFDQALHADGGLGQLSVTFDDGGDAELIVRSNSFTLPWDAAVRLLADGNNSAAVHFGGPNVGDPNIYVDGVVGGPGDDVGGPTQSPFNPWSVNVRNGGSMDLKIENEILPQHDDVFSAFNNSFDASINATGGTLNLHITDSASPDGYRFDISGGTVNLFNEQNVAACPRTAAQILDDNGNTGGGNSDATDPPLVVGAGVTCSTTPPTPPSVVIP